MMLGLLLARAGVDVVVLEKHADFLRDFRGDTVHPSTLEVIHELGLLDEFLKLPHRRVERLGGIVGDTPVTIADFSHLPTRCKFIALMPQWDFLNFLAEHGRRYPTFHLHMRAEVTDLIEEGGRVVGVRATTPDGPLEVRSTLVVGADGRGSVVRERAGLTVEDIGAPMDVLWMRLSRRDSDGAEALGRIAAGKMFVMIDRGDYWQCAYVIRKGAADEIKAQGLDAFREAIVGVAPLLRDRVQELKTLGRRQAPHREDRSPGAVAPAGAAVHRRCRARDVAGRRRRHQPRGAGCGGGRQPPGRAAARGHRERGRSRGGAAPPHVPDADDAAHPGVHPEQCAEPRAGEHASARRRPGRCGCSAAARCCSAFRRGWWGSACGPNMCWFRPQLCQHRALDKTTPPWRNSNLSEPGRRRVVLSAEKNKILTQVGPGTPMGDYLRRYWHPIGGASELDTNPIKAMRLLGEDLVLYKDLGGQYGLIDRNCPHRRADLSYGFVEQTGIRCNYHGWLMDQRGNVIEQPYDDTSIRAARRASAASPRPIR